MLLYYFSIQWLFEAFFILMAVLYFHKIKIPQNFIQKLSFKDIVLLVSNMLLGGIIYYNAHIFGATAPFDFVSIETLLLLILIAPIIEECIFRHVLFLPLINLIRKKWLSIVVISMIFSYAHLRALFGLSGASSEIKLFVIYQGAYTLLMSIGWSYLRLKRKSLLIAILLHMSFNFGFGVSGFIDKANLFKTSQVKTAVLLSTLFKQNLDTKRK